MKWLLLILLIGCQQDEITFKTVKRVTPPQEFEMSITATTDAKNPDLPPCPQKCPPGTSCNPKSHSCEGSAEKPSSSPASIKSLKPETALVFDSRYGTLYRP